MNTSHSDVHSNLQGEFREVFWSLLPKRSELWITVLVANLQSLTFKGGVQPAPKKSDKTKKASEIEVTFTTPAREFLHFNRYWVEKNGPFLQISLWFLDSFGISIPVFRGLIWETDFKAQIPQLKSYLVKVMAGPGDILPSTHPPIWNTPPVAFNILDCVSRGDFAEVVIRIFSHKFVTEAANAKTRMEGITHGIYVSGGNLHRQLVMELIKEAESSPSK